MLMDDMLSVATTTASFSDTGIQASFLAEIAIMIFTGVTGNSLLIAVFQKRHKKGFKAVNFFMLILACVDLVACVWTMPFTTVYMFRSMQSSLGCKLGFYFSGAMETMSVGTSLAIACERFLAIRRPHRLPLSKKRTYGCSALVAILLLAITTGLTACVSTEESGYCKVTMPYSVRLRAYLLTLFATVAVAYVAAFVLYGFVFSAIRTRGRLAARRRNTINSICSNGGLKPNSAADEKTSDMSAMEEELPPSPAQTPTSIAEAASNHHGTAPVEPTNHPYVDLSLNHQSVDELRLPVTNDTTIYGLQLVNFKKRGSQQPPTVAATTSADRKNADIVVAASKNKAQRLSWTNEYGIRLLDRQTSQEVKSSVFLVIVVINFVSWVPFVFSMGFPGVLPSDDPRLRFLFFINHILNVFVYALLSAHIRTELMTSLKCSRCCTQTAT